MKTRIISGLLMVPLLVILFLGDYVLMASVFLLGLGALYEFNKGFKNLDIKPSFGIGIFAAISIYLINLFNLPAEAYMFWMVVIVFASFIYMFSMDDKKLEDSMATIVGIFYITLFSYHVVLVDQALSPMIWLIVFAAFGTDVMAYFSGYFFGKHKLCPKISPKKTIEGAIGGTLGSVLLCGIYGYIVIPEYFVHTLIIGFIGSIISQLGDLSASIFKRKMGIKDYGNLIPGHGGVLDRIDSIIFTAPFVYYYIKFIIL